MRKVDFEEILLTHEEHGDKEMPILTLDDEFVLSGFNPAELAEFLNENNY